uniref:PDZ and LIM domain-containing protein n=1 Tax=Parasteatoda tepidariorum TaxID=114398 RepID=A0A2L2Y4M6_PARTP
MEARSFAGFNPRPSPWGYNWTTENISSTDYRNNSLPSKDSSSQSSPASNTATSSPEPQMLANQYANMPAALLTSLKRDKKPFTYTPGGVNLSEVLNARLQKRMERKKKYVEDRMNEDKNPIERLPKFEPPPKQVIVMPTYNSPLDMYSMENALEALECQAELVAADQSLSARSATLPRNHKFNEDDRVSQSKAFKVLQIITDTEEDASGKGKGNHYQDEMRFTGIRDSKTIPSKFFQTLQKITGTDEDDELEDSSSGAETVRTVVFEKQSVRPGFQQHQNVPQHSPPMQNHVPQFKPSNQHKTVHFQEPVTNNNLPGLKRPAAFLPMKTGGDPMTRVKPVHPSFLTNGPRKGFNPSGVTDF